MIKYNNYYLENVDNKRLAAEMYYCSEVAPQEQISNEGGLQIHQFEQYLRPSDDLLGLRHIFGEVLAEKEGARPADIQMWLNINPPGSHNHFHEHGQPEPPYTKMVSGIYYVVVPDDSGALVFKDGNDIDKMTPEDGMFVTFDSQLWHAVNPNNSPYDRMSIAFNAVYMQ